MNLPAYTTITAQSFSPNGEYLAIGNDQGQVCIFKTLRIFGKDKPLVFQFNAGLILDDENSKHKGCVNAMKSTDTFLIIAISRPVESEAAIVAFNWKDLIQQRSKLAWSIEASSGLLPTDINSIDINKDDQKIYVVGGIGTNSIEPIKDHAVRIIDLETRMESRKPLLGHLGYLHGVEHCATSKALATCSEDGSVRTWDSNRSKNACTSILEPFKEASLQRPKLGKWLSDVSINGDWLVTGGGPRPSIWHLKAQSPTVLPQLMNNDETSPLFVAKILKCGDQRIVFGGQYSHIYQYNFNGDLKAEVKTSATCTYSAEATSQSDFSVLSFAGSNSKIDLCTHSFSYVDDFIHFP